MSDYKQNYMLGVVYEAVSRLLPVMGKDFKINVQFLDDNHMNITVDDLTPLGTAVKRVLLANLNETIKVVQKEKEEDYGRKASDESGEHDPVSSATGSAASASNRPAEGPGNSNAGTDASGTPGGSAASPDSSPGAGAPPADNGYDH